jgi:hypothetical protein
MSTTAISNGYGHRATLCNKATSGVQQQGICCAAIVAKVAMLRGSGLPGKPNAASKA